MTFLEQPTLSSYKFLLTCVTSHFLTILQWFLGWVEDTRVVQDARDGHGEPGHCGSSKAYRASSAAWVTPPCAVVGVTLLVTRAAPNTPPAGSSLITPGPVKSEASRCRDLAPGFVLISLNVSPYCNDKPSVSQVVDFPLMSCLLQLWEWTVFDSLWQHTDVSFSKFYGVPHNCFSVTVWNEARHCGSVFVIVSLWHPVSSLQTNTGQLQFVVWHRHSCIPPYVLILLSSW